MSVIKPRLLFSNSFLLIKVLLPDDLNNIQFMGISIMTRNGTGVYEVAELAFLRLHPCSKVQ